MMHPGKFGRRRVAFPLFSLVYGARWVAGPMRKMGGRAEVAKMTGSMKGIASSIRLLNDGTVEGIVLVTGLMRVQQTMANKVQNRP